jgi:cardiolipin synthase
LQWWIRVQKAQARHPRIELFLKIVLVAAIVTATVLALAQDQETVELRSAISAEDPAAPEYLAALVAADLVDGNTYDVLVNGDRVFPAMLQAMNEATERISFETYIYEEGRVADQFTDALENAVRRGVTVNIILDALGTGSMDKSHFERLQKAGCHIVNFNPTAWYTLEELNYRTHRKILVVDGSVAFTGGVGIADHWLGNAQDPQHTGATRTCASGSDRANPRGRVLRELRRRWVHGHSVLTDPGRAHDADDHSMVVRSSPSDGASDLKRLYLLAIAMARRSIEISSPYFVTDESTMWALDDARKRGVTIRVLVESDTTDHKSVKYASRDAYDDMLEGGIQVYEYQPTMMHTKTMVIDGVLNIFDRRTSTIDRSN